ncbi:M48 family metallopeptidase [Flavobacterium sp.]|uniref:M48 family metallopeptidase n=1 Tax=Flavobacterium sp. TaxID=239 RepID=UPI003798F43B
MEKAKGFFYDGVSSVSQEVTVAFDTEKSIFIFENTHNVIYSWKLADVTFIRTDAVLQFQHGKDPIQSLKIEDSKFIADVAVFRKKNGHIGLYQKLLDLGIKAHISLAIIILGFIGLSYVYVMPWVGEKSVFLIPDSYDDVLGNTFFQQNTFLGKMDPDKTKALNLFAKELKLNNTKKLKFSVINSDIMNAFALPDGSIVVYTGIIDSMEGYDELVGLIGHEVSHVNNRHSMKMLCRNLSGYLFVSTALGDANGVMAVLGNNINTLQSLTFSREFERQADVEGFKIVTLNGVNPKGMTTLFKRLQKENNSAIPEFLSSHPVTADRIKDIEKLIKTKNFQYRKDEKLQLLFQKVKGK